MARTRGQQYRVTHLNADCLASFTAKLDRRMPPRDAQHFVSIWVIVNERVHAGPKPDNSVIFREQFVERSLCPRQGLGVERPGVEEERPTRVIGNVTIVFEVEQVLRHPANTFQPITAYRFLATRSQNRSA
jgi:hypothetical protein